MCFDEEITDKANTPNVLLDLAQELAMLVHVMLQQDNSWEKNDVYCGLGRELNEEELLEIATNSQEAHSQVVTFITELLCMKLKDAYNNVYLDITTTDTGKLQLILVLCRAVHTDPANP